MTTCRTPRGSGLQKGRLPALALACALLSSVLWVGAPDALAAPPALMTSAEVQSGMTGYGLSVFKGTKIERFSVSVIGVLKNAFPKMDMILIRCAGQGLEHSGIVAGMSGSPIYLTVEGQDRLIGALAYGWQFSKDPIAGVTPIHNMLDEAKRPLRNVRDAAAALAPSPVDAQGVPVPPSGFTALSSHPQLRPASTPLFMTGATGPVIEAAASLLRQWNFEPMQGGGTSSADVKASEKVDLEPGSSIGVLMVRGDIEMVGVGTVTYRDGDTVLAFGHPMMGLGELQFPITTAYVQHTFAGMARSFKMAGALSTVGTLVQDRRPTIVGKVGPTVPLIPLKITVKNDAAKRQDVFNMEMIHHRQFTPILAFISMMNSITTAASDQTEVSYAASVRLKLPGREPIELRDHLFSPSGVMGFGLFTSPVFRALQELYANPFQEVRAESIEYSLDLVFKRDLARLESVELQTEAVVPGQKAKATVRLRPYMGEPYDQTVEFLVPEELAGETVLVHFAGGTNAPVDLVAPETFEDLVKNLGRRHPSKSIVVTVQTPSPSFKFRGQKLSDLPRTALDALNSANSSGRGLVGGGVEQTVIPAAQVIVGVRPMRIRVKRLDE